MLACRRACHSGLSAMAINEASAWSRRRTHGPALVGSRGASTRRRLLPCASKSSAAGASAPVEELACRGLCLLISPACPPKPCAKAGRVALNVNVMSADRCVP